MALIALVRSGLRVVNARKLAMCLSAAMMPVAMLAVRVESWQLALLCMSVAAFGHQCWAASMLTLPADLFPKRIVASCYGLPAMCGILAGAATQWFVGGAIVSWGYVPAFTIAGLMHPIAACIVLFGVRTPAAAPVPAVTTAAAPGLHGKMSHEASK